MQRIGDDVALSSDQFVRIAKALADPRRLQILETIAECGELACRRLCEDLPVAQPTVSHHVRELMSAGLVESRREGQFVYYRFRADVFRQYLGMLEQRVGLGGPRPARSASTSQSNTVPLI
jgi:ArsR family transcriptional regulator